MGKTWFTPEEANALLPKIREEVGEIQALKRKIETRYLYLKQLKSQTGKAQADKPDPFFMLESELEFMQIEAQTLVQSIHMKGAQLKDIDMGLVDFPSVRDGKEVLLCWRLGEDEVGHWHGLDEGFIGRKRID